MSKSSTVRTAPAAQAIHLLPLNIGGVARHADDCTGKLALGSVRLALLCVSRRPSA